MMIGAVNRSRTKASAKSSHGLIDSYRLIRTEGVAATASISGNRT